MDVTLKDIPIRNVAYLKCRASWRQIPSMIGRLDDIVINRALGAKGPPSGIYYNTPGEVAIESLDWEVFYPISATIPSLFEDDTGFGIRELPSIKVAATVYKGSYRKTGSTYAALEDWVRSNDLKVCGPSQEEYLYGLIDTQSVQVVEIKFPVCSSHSDLLI